MLDPNYRRGKTEKGWQLQTHGSGLLEQVLEYQLLAALTPELLRRGMRFEVLRGDFDLDGYDLIIEAGGVLRHIQLKSMTCAGKARSVLVSTRLRAKPSGCIVWMNYDPETLTITGLRWFGSSPGERLPHPGDRVARHSRANTDGVKGYRKDLRILPSGRFGNVSDIAALADRLFGPPEVCALRRHLAARAEPATGWLAAVQTGKFSAIPEDLGWAGAVELAHLIDGYTLAEELQLGDPFTFAERQLEHAMATGEWVGNAAELWITLFLEYRRCRMSSPFEPHETMVRLLNLLVCRLRDALDEGSRQ